MTLVRHFTTWAMLLICMMLIALPCNAAQSLDNDTAKIVSGIEKKYANKSFTADFEQASRLTALDVTEIAKGKAWFSHPGKMKWAYENSDNHEIITNGKELWIYRPQENQVMIGDAAPFFQSGSGGAFLADIRKIREEFTIEPGRSGENFAQLELTPKKETPELAKIRITVDLPGYEISVVETENIYGDTTKFIFTNIQFSTFDEQIFELTPPPGTEIIEMD
ncbi:outer membrane lipoprotein carrier protein LolA [Desulfobacter hydrogenophilus]|uniref:Outer membrane lipoprotein carrier protein LolA n=1 Tax=Desulfobacter hydrogenophilus TaxID=2291 RepID=A0A328FKH5_9BACT|nr:outer membrane lipoprotein carrier protein LolA [Desulfobacter hydrogenophilus]NDY71430.1 outer membrane lipoprotein carrier protein LolA [Desulfobacter hydrogenophilus]QBH12170.1 outer membrane lipoprotein carrier protein LolA [Desulfobacter hydrogenophilus]RAM03507.1 outer membrane lipoprotein carrier protein LolA [Desulfobacter hydrogenophilus]